MIPPWTRPSANFDSKVVGLGRAGLHEHVLASCKPPTKAALLAVLLPTTTITSDSSRHLRELVCEHWQPVLVLSGQGLVPGVHEQFDACLVALRPVLPAWQPLRMFRVPRLDDDRDAIEHDLVALLARPGGRTKFGYVVREALPPGESWAFGRHDPAVLACMADLEHFGKTAPLSDVFEILPQAVHTVLHRDAMRAEPEPGSARVLRGRDIRADGTVAPADEQTSWVHVDTDRLLAAGDSRPSRCGARRTLHRGISPGLLTTICRSLRVRAFWRCERVRSPASKKWNSAYLFLRSRQAAELLAAHAGPTLHIQRNLLSQLRLPQPDGALVQRWGRFTQLGISCVPGWCRSSHCWDQCSSIARRRTRGKGCSLTVGLSDCELAPPIWLMTSGIALELSFLTRLLTGGER